MGANNSSRRVSFESDEKENITVVKGIRLSENVINRMREPAAPPKVTSKPLSVAGSPSPLPPPVPPLTSLPPPPPLVESAVPPAPSPTAPSAPEKVAVPPPPKQVATPTVTERMLPPDPPQTAANAAAAAAPDVEHVAVPPAPPAVDRVTLPTPPSTAPFAHLVPPPTPAVAFESLAPPPLVINQSPPNVNQSISGSPLYVDERVQSSLFEKNVPIMTSPLPDTDPHQSAVSKHVTIPPPPPCPSEDTVHPQHAKSFASPPLPDFTAPCDPLTPPPQPQVEPVPPASVPKRAAVPESVPVPTPAAPAVDEEAQRRKIADELYKGLEQKRANAEQELQAWIEEEKARVSAQAEVQTQVKDEVFKILSSEKAAAKEDLQRTLMKERIAVEDEKLRVDLYAKRLQAKEADLQKQDAFYRQQVARLEDRSAQFYKVTTESYHKAADEVNAKFKRYEVHPVCADLQGQILKCYRENTSKTLLCSDIAALYLQCVNNAKQNKLRPGG